MQSETTVWLLERSQQENERDILWWAANFAPTPWTKEALAATWFARQQDAEAVKRKFGIPYCHASEHVFMDIDSCSGLCWGCERTKDHLDDTEVPHHKDGSICEHRETTNAK